MESSPYGFLVNPNLPSEEELVALSIKQGFEIPRTTVIDPRTGSVIAFLKYGFTATVEHARTQDWTAKALRVSGHSDVQVPRVYHAFLATLHDGDVYGYIAMEYIEGEDCKLNKDDVELGVKAVQALISLRAPADATLGHLGGGTRSIVHCFYPEWHCDAEYRTDQDFFDHMRNLFKRFYADTQFDGDISGYERFLCPCDIHEGNFRKLTTEDGQIIVVALDFTATCFMPLPFVRLALHQVHHSFGQAVAKRVAFPPFSETDFDVVDALHTISSLLTPFGRTIRLPKGVTHRIPGNH